MRSKCLGFLLLVAVLVTGSPARASSAARDLSECTFRLQQLGRAILLYRRQHGVYPPHLSDLYPRYARNIVLLHCPADHTAGQPGYNWANDPRFPVSYYYELTSDVVGPSSVLLGPQSLSGRATARDNKLAQVQSFGLRVPMVRCWHHFAESSHGNSGTVLNLTLDGKVFQSGLRWETETGTVMAVMDRLDQDLRKRPDAFARLWMPARLLPYLQEALHPTREQLAWFPGRSRDAGLRLSRRVQLTVRRIRSAARRFPPRASVAFNRLAQALSAVAGGDAPRQHRPRRQTSSSARRRESGTAPGKAQRLVKFSRFFSSI